MKCMINDYFTPDREGYTVTDLCKYVGISRTAYYKILNDEAEPKLSTALKIAEYFADTTNWHSVTVQDLWTID